MVSLSIYLLNSDYGFFLIVFTEYGTLPMAGGSGAARLSYLVPPLDAIKSRASQDGTLVQYILNNTILSGPAKVRNRADGLGFVLPVPEVCLVFLKTWASEGVDRLSLEADWNSTTVVNNVASYCNNTIVITHSAGLNVLPWAKNPNVTAILAAHLPGQESGNSLVDILYGTINPSGKLPYTIALNASDYNFAPVTNSTELQGTEDPNAWQSNFTEGQLIDYRHFDYYNQSILYEFGYGLSYTNFSLSDLQIESTAPGEPVTARPPPAATAPGGNPTLWAVLYVANVTVTNTGNTSGSTVPQLYVSLPSTAQGNPTPVNVLRGFDKVFLQPGQSTSVQFPLARRDLSYWDTTLQEWIISSGAIGVHVGFSSRDLKLHDQIEGSR